MTLRNRSWVVLATTMLGSLAACGPTVGGVGTEGESESSTGGTTGGDPTNPNPTMPNPTTADPSVGTGDVTGDATSLPPLDSSTSPPDDTTGGGSDSCCEPHGTPGCNEEAVVDCVCGQEAFCCAFEWDQNCVDLAVNSCMATCEEPPPGTTTDEPGTTTGEPGGACDEVVTIEMFPADATHSGAWGLVMSMYEPYEVSGLNQMMGQEGSILYEPEIPCDDTFYVWVRYWDQNTEDSYFVTVDGQPMPEAIFEGDCTNNDPMGTPYGWRLLNWRDQAANACEYVQDPWTHDWTAGVHQLEFSYRESLAMGRIVITNDPAYMP